MRKIVQFLNPLAHLGDRYYSIVFPLLANIALCVLSEVYAYGIARNPMSVGIYIIFLDVASIIYFSLREGIRGGFTATTISVIYYFYIIYTRHYSKDQLSSGIDTTIVLAILYFLLSFIIGMLKQRIDRLIEIQSDERKRLEAVIQQLPTGVIITDNTGSITHINRQVDKILGIKIPVGFKIGIDTLPKVKINGSAINLSQSPTFNALQSGKSIVDREMIFERKDGTQAYLLINSTPIHNSKQETIAAASIIADITSQKEIERQKDDFMSMASHELKTPITSLKIFIDLQTKQLEEKDPKKAKYYNERIRDQANRLKELTNDLLDVARVKTGKLHFNNETFDIMQVIEDTVESLQDSTKKHKLIVKSTNRLMVLADRYRMYQVLVNLITNAIKYSPHSSDIIVEVKRIKQFAVISVKDFGIGIDKQQQKKIFGRLYQVTDPNEKTFPGLGLGLYISKEIIMRLKGKMWVESIKGKGSTFFFSLPLVAKKM